MKRQKDIFDLFRKNQYKLSERPSARTWRRLERRLDFHKKHGQTTLYRNLAMVAGILALVAIISLITVLVNNKQTNFKTLNQTPRYLEELAPGNIEGEVPKLVEFTRLYQELLTKPIAEGEPSRRLVAQSASAPKK